jgi:hypothetical protein
MKREPQSLTVHLRHAAHRIHRAAWMIDSGATALHCGRVLALMATTLEVYTHASGSAQRDAVNMLADQLFPSVPKLDGSGNTAQEETQVIQ